MKNQQNSDKKVKVEVSGTQLDNVYRRTEIDVRGLVRILYRAACDELEPLFDEMLTRLYNIGEGVDDVNPNLVNGFTVLVNELQETNAKLDQIVVILTPQEEQ